MSTSPPSDRELLLRFHEHRNEAAFTELYQRYAPLVFAVCRRVLRDAHLAEDATSAAFLVLAKEAASMSRDARPLGAWLYRVATNIARNVGRSEGRRRVREQAAGTAATSEPDAAATAELRCTQLHVELERLPEKYRTAIVLHHLEGRSYEDAAAALGCNRGVFGVRLARAREMLRQRVVARGIALDADGVTDVFAEERATSVALPAGLAAATCQAASLLAAGKTLTGSGLVSAKVAYLTQNALKMLFWAKVKTAALATAASLAVVAGGGLAVHQALAHQTRVTPPPTVAAARTGMAPIPGGTNAGTNPDTMQPYSLTVESFLMDRCEVTKALWDEVAAWGREHGYRFSVNAGQGKAPDHPVHSVSWYDCVIWCNARSEKDGFAPVYYRDAAGSVVWRGPNQVPYVKAAADGYRLPTLVEWQYAARGGQPSHRLPWHDTETITHARANYWSYAKFPGDTSPTRGHHPTYAVEPKPYTSPVGVFAPNAYGLYDLVGNVKEWCFDDADDLWRKYVGSSWNMPPTPVSKSEEEFVANAATDLGFRTVRTPRATNAPTPDPRP